MGLGFKNSHLKLICFVSVSSVLFVLPIQLLVKRGFILLGLPCQFSQVLSILFKRVCLACVHSVRSLCLLVGLGVKKFSSEVDLPRFRRLGCSILCSLCLLVGLGVKNSHLKLICFGSVSSALFVP